MPTSELTNRRRDPQNSRFLKAHKVSLLILGVVDEADFSRVGTIDMLDTCSVKTSKRLSAPFQHPSVGMKKEELLDFSEHRRQVAQSGKNQFLQIRQSDVRSNSTRDPSCSEDDYFCSETASSDYEDDSSQEQPVRFGTGRQEKATTTSSEKLKMSKSKGYSDMDEHGRYSGRSSSSRRENRPLRRRRSAEDLRESRFLKEEAPREKVELIAQSNTAAVAPKRPIRSRLSSNDLREKYFNTEAVALMDSRLDKKTQPKKISKPLGRRLNRRLSFEGFNEKSNEGVMVADKVLFEPKLSPRLSMSKNAVRSPSRKSCAEKNKKSRRARESSGEEKIVQTDHGNRISGKGFNGSSGTSMGNRTTLDDHGFPMVINLTDDFDWDEHERNNEDDINVFSKQIDYIPSKEQANAKQKVDRPSSFSRKGSRTSVVDTAVSPGEPSNSSGTRDWGGAIEDWEKQKNSSLSAKNRNVSFQSLRDLDAKDVTPTYRRPGNRDELSKSDHRRPMRRELRQNDLSQSEHNRSCKQSQHLGEGDMMDATVSFGQAKSSLKQRVPSFESLDHLMKQDFSALSANLKNCWSFASSQVLVNMERTKHGLNVLDRSKELDEMAYQYAVEMSQNGGLEAIHICYPGHVLRGESIQSIHERIMNQESPKERENILNADFEEYGMASVTRPDGMVYLCQLFRGNI